MDFTGRPAQLILIASVARRYYLEDKSKIEIAEELGLSRFKVARLLETARESGLVHIEIAYLDMIDIDLSHTAAGHLPSAACPGSRHPRRQPEHPSRAV